MISGFGLGQSRITWSAKPQRKHFLTDCPHDVELKGFSPLLASVFFSTDELPLDDDFPDDSPPNLLVTMQFRRRLFTDSKCNNS